MSKLASLRSQLGAIRRKRQVARWATAYSSLGIAILLALVTLFVVDLVLFRLGANMSRPQRLVAIGLAAIALVWAYRRYTRPWLGQRETDLDMALMVERQQRIDSDLVAALQFESPEAARWGSTQLEGAVVDYVADYSRGWEILEGFDRRGVVRRLGTFAAAAAVVGICALIFWGYTAAFLNRLAMGNRHYPTRTSIDEIVVNGKSVEPGSEVRSAYGEPVKFTIRASKELPADGLVEMTTLASGVMRTVPLTPTTSGNGTAEFSGEFDQLVDSVNFQVRLNDAHTDAAGITVIALPAVAEQLTPTPPEYARFADRNAGVPVSARQISVLEGSQVALDLQCLNKRLTSATVTIGDKSYPLQSQDAEGKAWQLTEKTPLDHVSEGVNYAIQVTDEDGMSLQQPLRGSIRIKADRKPSIIAGLETHYVLPSAKPKIGFRASDDFGVGEIRAHVEILQQGSPGEPGESKTLPPIVVQRAATDPAQITPSAKSDYTLDLSKFKVAKGDQVKVSLEVTDYRGPGVPGQTELSEPLTLNVTDLSGVYAAMYELEEKAYRQTSALIDRQTETGGSK